MSASERAKRQSSPSPPREGGLAGLRRAFDAQRARASRLIRDGQASGAWAEFLKGAQQLPVGPPLVAALGRVAAASRRVGALLSWLEPQLDQLDGEVRLGVLRALARARRRGGDIDGARATLERALAEHPDDRRARFALNALLLRDERWGELDRSLEREVKEAARRGAYDAASRAALRRARVWSERLHNPGRAALRYAQAAEYAERAEAIDRAYLLRVLEVRSLYVARASTRAIGLAGAAVVRLGERLGASAPAQVMLDELRAAQGDERARRLTDPQVQIVDSETPDRAQTVEAMPAIRPQAQASLLAAADAFDSASVAAEVTALLVAALDEAPGVSAMQRLEKHCEARGAWAELALAYRDAWSRAERVQEQLLWATRLAEVLENRLLDHVGAAEVRAQSAALAGDVTVSTLIDTEEAPSAPEGTAAERAQAWVERAEHAVAEGAYAAARADYRRALTAAPSLLSAHAGLAELAAVQGDLRPAKALARAVFAAEVSDARLEAMRRVARLADGPLRDQRLATDAWRVVNEARPDDGEAIHRLALLSRAAGDWASVERLARAQLERDPSAETARFELVATLEATDRADEALAELRELVRRSPSNGAAWLMLADRLIQRRTLDDAVWVLEFAAAATLEPLQKMLVYRRLARLVKEGLNDSERAEVFANRASELQADLLVEVPGARPASEGALPFDPVEASSGRDAAALAEDDFDEIAAALEAKFEVDELRELGDEGEEPPTGRFDRSGRGEALGDPASALPPSFGPSPGAAALSTERTALFEQVRREPLRPEGYRALADHFDTTADALRAGLMLEVARALEGDPHAAPRAPRLAISATDRLGLKHPTLRTEQGELLALVGLLLCRLAPRHGPEALDALRLDAGKGAKAAADALLAAVRILGVRAPDVLVSRDAVPPLSIAFVDGPRVMVGRAAVRKPVPDAELRFYAGRALFTLSPELLALRLLRRNHLERGLSLIRQVVQGTGSSVEVRLVRDALTPAAWQRLKTLAPRHADSLDLNELAEGARHSANRAGLVVCGAVAPVIAALRSKKALPAELTELVRFATSERYLQLRTRVVPTK